MRRAIELAMRHRPHPNPRVGAVVVSPSGVVVGEGSHIGPGTDHAEISALDSAGDRTAGSTLYVNLEPCAHHGRTPPCVDRIIKDGVKRVVFGVTDPDSRVAGRGAATLRSAGIEVVQDFAPSDVRHADPAYFHHRETGMPLVTMKYAMTLDGSVAARDRSSKWITSDEARRDAHELRARSDAVVVGAGTLRSDDPRLNVRTEGFAGEQPRPVVVAGNEELPRGASIWERDPLVVTTHPIDVPAGELLVVDAGTDGWPDPRMAALELADAGLLDILIEGGPTLAGAWWRTGVITKGVVYLGGKIGGGLGIPPLHAVFETLDEAEPAHMTAIHSLGPDVRIDFERPKR